MTRRERLESKLDRRLEWAEKRQSKSAALIAGHAVYRGDHAFNFQPGHIPQRARIIAQEDRAFEHRQVARHHEEKAAGLSTQLATSIYSDDPDAPERLREKLASLEAERDRIKAYNKSCRAAAKSGQSFGDLTLLDEAQRKSLEITARVCPYQLGKGGSSPAYVLTNLGGNISRAKERLAEIERRAARQAAAEQAGGVVISRNTEHGYCSVTFAEKPDRSVLDALRSAGFAWTGGGAGAGIPRSSPPKFSKWSPHRRTVRIDPRSATRNPAAMSLYFAAPMANFDPLTDT